MTAAATADATAQGTTNAGATGSTGKADETKTGTVVGDAATGTQKTGDAAEAGKTGETKAQGDGTAAGAGETKPKPPEKYELKLPDGGHLDQGDLDNIAGIAKQIGWSNEEAQAAVDEQNTMAQAQSARYLAETKADKEIGGDNLELSQRLARAVINRVYPEGDPFRAPFLAFVNRGGAGNNIHVVRFLARLGKMMAEDGPIRGQEGSGGQEKTAAEVLYGKNT